MSAPIDLELAPMSGNAGAINRRSFVKCLGAGAALAAGAALGAADTAAASGPRPTREAEEDDPALGVLIDLTRCSGCQSCALACKAANKLPDPELTPAKLDAGAYSFVDERQLADGAPAFVKRQCMHCLHPACASACTVGALRKTVEGPVVYDSAKCIGCRYCQYACPFGVPTYQWDNVFGLIQKCQFCFARVNNGSQPACVAACPNGALRFGKRHELLAQAKGQIASNPNRYIDHVYGETEAGGTSMLYLSDVPFAQLGFSTLANTPPSENAEAVMQLTLPVAAAVATVATGLHLIFRRRQQVAAYNRQQAEYARQQASKQAGNPAGQKGTHDEH